MGRVRTPALYLEMCFIKLCTPTLDLDEKSLSARIDRLEQIVGNGTAAKPVYYNSIPEEKSSAVTAKPNIPKEIEQTGAFRIDIPDVLK